MYKLSNTKLIILASITLVIFYNFAFFRYVLNIYAGSAARLFNAVPYVIIVAVLLAASILKNRNSRLRGFQNE